MAAAPWSDGIYIQYTKADGTKTSQVFIECGEPIGYPNTTEKLGDYLDRVAQGWDIQFGEVANKIKCQKGINWYDVDTESLSYTYEGGVVLDIYMKIPSNPTISQLFMDGVTYDLKDKNAGSGLPEGGTEGQVLTKTATGTEWSDASGGSSLDVMLQDDYDKKSDAEKMDGTFRFIYIEQES